MRKMEIIMLVPNWFTSSDFFTFCFIWEFKLKLSRTQFILKSCIFILFTRAICKLVCPPVYLSICYLPTVFYLFTIHVYLSTCLPVYLVTGLSINLSTCLQIYLSTRIPSIWMFLLGDDTGSSWWYHRFLLVIPQVPLRYETGSSWRWNRFLLEMTQVPLGYDTDSS